MSVLSSVITPNLFAECSINSYCRAFPSIYLVKVAYGSDRELQCQRPYTIKVLVARMQINRLYTFELAGLLTDCMLINC